MKAKRSDKQESLPWEVWELDKKFFNALTEYSVQHPETSLDRVLDKVKAGLEEHKELFELVPESPFPARGLVKALAHLIKLGVSVSRAKANVQQFADTVIGWVLEVKSAYGSSNGQKFTWATWKHLSKMRDLVDEVCFWALTRLKDRRWTRISGGMKIGSEIADFNARISEAKELFRDLSIVTFASGIDAILAALKLILRRQDGITKEILKIRRDQSRQMNYLVNEFEERKQREERRNFLANTLTPLTVANPTYTEQGKLPCDEGTRVQVLAEILAWIRDISSTSQGFLWLSGDPGCGKSAITASIARECKDQGTLWAQFFINRNNEDTTNPNLYFPSIAQQLITKSAEVEQAVYDTLKAKPSLLDRITPEQAAKLFIDSIAVATGLERQKPVVVVIDGLDETDPKCLRDTAIIFAHLFRGLAPFPNAKVFVSSRTEDDIRNPFAKNMKAEQVKHIHLDTSAKSSVDDVAIYLRRRIERIVEQNDLNWTIWPGERRMIALAARASGLFIWAVTVSNFLEQQISILGTECLEDVLNVLSGNALGDINTLYGVILRLTYQGQADPWEFEKFRRIVGTILTLKERLSLRHISALLNLRRTPDSPPVDLVKFVQRLRTVLVAGTEAVGQDTIPRVHKSFFEYITSTVPNSFFQVQTRTAEAELAISCFKQLACFSVLAEPATASEATIPRHSIYAYQHWSSHMEAVVASHSGALFVNNHMNPHTLLDRLSLRMDDQGRPPFHLSQDLHQSLLYVTSPSGVQSWDIESGHRRLVTVVQAQTSGISSIAFSRKAPNQLLFGSSSNPKLQLHDLHANTPAKHGLGILNLARLSGVTTVVYHRGEDRLGGELFAVGFDDGEVRLWVPEIQELVPFRLKHNAAVQCLAFSEDGRALLSGSKDGRVLLWGLEWPNLSLLDTLVQHTDAIVFVGVVWGQSVVAVASDGSIFVHRLRSSSNQAEELHKAAPWNIKLPEGIICAASSPFPYQLCVATTSGGCLLLSVDDPARASIEDRVKIEHELPESRFGVIRSCAFSSKGTILALGSDDGLVHLVNPASLQPLAPAQHYHHRGAVTTVAFSPRGDVFASVSDSVIRLWRVYVGARDPDLIQPIQPILPSQWMCTFSTDRRMVAAVSPSALYIWDSKELNSRSLVPPVDHTEFRCIAFSPDASRLVGVSTFGVYLWDTTTKKMLGSASHMFSSPEISVAFYPRQPQSPWLFVTVEQGQLERSIGWHLQNGDLNQLGPILHDKYIRTTFQYSLEARPVEFAGIEDSLFYHAVPTGERDARPGLWVCFKDSMIYIREDKSMSIFHFEPTMIPHATEFREHDSSSLSDVEFGGDAEVGDGDD